MSEPAVTYVEKDSFALITIDDGKANVLSESTINELHGALDRAEEAGKAIVIAGRPGRFSGGFDLKVMMSGPEAARKLVSDGAKLLMRIYGFRRPVVMACTGHAVAGGALLLATGDTRIGIQGDFKFGLNEVEVGLPVPIMAHQLAADRLQKREFTAAVLQSKFYDVESAIEAGWLDAAVPAEELEAAAIAEVERLAKLPERAYAMTKSSIRDASIAFVLETLSDNLTELLGG